MIGSLSELFRPQKFEEVIGHQLICRGLRNAITNKFLDLSFLLSGLWGTGKTTLALLFARAILCEHPNDGEPCNTCESCISAINGYNQNLIELDAASHGKIEDIRQIIDLTLHQPIGSAKRVVIFDESHMITQEGQNAFLSVLEPGSTTTIFIFCTTAPEKMLPTILSRCIKFSLNPPTPTEIRQRLNYICVKSNIDHEPQALEYIVQFSGGHVRDAINLLDVVRRLGPVDVSSVRSYLNLDTKLYALAILQYLISEPVKALTKADEALSKIDPLRLYEYIGIAAFDAYRILVNDLPEDYIEYDIAKKISQIYGNSCIYIAKKFLNIPRSVTRASLLADLYLIREEIQTAPSAIKTSVLDIRDRAIATVPESAPVPETKAKVEEKRDMPLTPEKIAVLLGAELVH